MEEAACKKGELEAAGQQAHPHIALSGSARLRVQKVSVFLLLLSQLKARQPQL